MARSRGEIEEIRKLFLEYAKSLDFDLCFQDFDRELRELPGEYAEPHGRLILAKYDGKCVGCVGLRKLQADICEMKRLYVKPGYRGRGIGKELARRIIAEARAIGYRKMRLDTISDMIEAIALYKSLGFNEIGPYRPNPIEGAKYFELRL
ncbi:MAG: GNAT family N-acetyltransferase [Thermoplasmata archaeon]